MTFAKASRFAGNHDVVLVGYRGVDGSVRLDCPEVESALKHSTDFLGREVDAAPTPTPSGPAPTRLQDDGVDLAGYDAAAAGRRSRGRARGARLRPHRPPQRERRDAHGDDLRLALPGEHPPLGDDRRQPARPLPLGREDDRRADRPLLRPLREGRDAAASGPTTSPRRCGGRPPTSPTTGSSCRSRQGNVRIASFFGLMESTSEAAPLSAPMTLELVALRGEGRRERVLVPVAAGRPASSRSRSSGASTPPPARPTPGRRATTSRRRRRTSSILGEPAARSSSGPAARWPTPGRRPRTRTSTTACGRRTCETLLIGGALDFATPPQVATKELLPYLPNGHQVVLPGLGHSTSFWTYAARGRAPACSTRTSTAARSTTRSTRRAKVDFTPDVTQTALGQGHRRHDGRPRAPHRALAALDGRAACTGADASDARRARCCARCTRSCSASAAGSSAS